MSLKYVIRVLLTPGCWMQNDGYSADWDRELNALLDTEYFEVIDRCNARLGPRTVWFGNHPYASFTVEDKEWAMEHLADSARHRERPKRATILRAFDKLTQDIRRWRTE